MAEYGCIICKQELIYKEKSEQMICAVCKEEKESNAVCRQGHFICDACHSSGALEYIENYCRNSTSSNPVAIALELMNNPKIKMHGPEHHFLVPAVLITVYYNAAGKPDIIPEKLEIAGQRSKNVPGGYCGFFGACGAAIGTGTFMSIILEANPLSKKEWRLANLITAGSLEKIALSGGPRCCKRDSYIAIENSIRFVKENLNVELESQKIECVFSGVNKECLYNKCRYFRDKD